MKKYLSIPIILAFGLTLGACDSNNAKVMIIKLLKQQLVAITSLIIVIFLETTKENL